MLCVMPFLVRGIFGLARRFRISDRDKSGSIDFHEFQVCSRSARVLVDADSFVASPSRVMLGLFRASGALISERGKKNPIYYVWRSRSI